MAVAHLEGRRIRIQGTVQGVGFRPWIYRTACESGITGRVRNDSAGQVQEPIAKGHGSQFFHLGRQRQLLHG